MLLPPGYLHTSGSLIVDGSNEPARLAGVNWYGFECNSFVAGGLDHQSVDAICARIVALGFNTIRLPFSSEMVTRDPVITEFVDANPDLRGLSSLQIMQRVILTAAAHGLKIILDCHRSDAGWSWQSNGLWYTRDYPASAWIPTWVEMVTEFTTSSGRFECGDAIIGCDLRNEPGSPPPDPTAWPANNGSVWGFSDPRYDTASYPDDWATAANEAGNAILAVNPNLLIFVEGVRRDPAGPFFGGQQYNYWPGGNLMGVGVAGGHRAAPVPIDLVIPNRLVYSAHDYGPAMHNVAWCRLDDLGKGTGATAEACHSVWDQAWGYITREGIAPVWIGEFGTPNGLKSIHQLPQEDYAAVNPDHAAQGYWFSYLVQYIGEHNLHWCYWALNGTQSLAPGRSPFQIEGYGILDPTWTTSASKPVMAKLATIQ